MPIVRNIPTDPTTSSHAVGAVTPLPTKEVYKTTVPTGLSVHDANSITTQPNMDTYAALAYIAGTNWSVDYYSQILTPTSELAGLQTGASGISQQFTLIKQLEIKLQSTLNVSQDAVTKTMNLSGTAIVYAGVIPNQGDSFVGVIENGSPYVFKVITSDKKQVFKEAAYEISFEVIGSQKEYLELLNQSVAKTVYFIKDHIQYGKSPVLLDSQYKSSINAQKLWREMFNEYMDHFFSDKFQTLVVPGDDGIYDPYVVRFIREQFDTHHHPNLVKLRNLNIDEMLSKHSEGIYSAVSKRQPGLLSSGFTMSALKTTYEFNKNPRLATVRYSGLLWINGSVDHKRRVDESQIDQNSTFAAAGYSLAQAIWYPKFKPYTKDLGFYSVAQIPTYVFNASFYQQDRAKMKLFERVVYDYICRTQNSEEGIRYLIATANELRHHWSDLDSFYLMPLLIVIIRDIAYNPANYSEFTNIQDLISNGKDITNVVPGGLDAADLIANWANLDGLNIYEYFMDLLESRLKL